MRGDGVIAGCDQGCSSCRNLDPNPAACCLERCTRPTGYRKLGDILASSHEGHACTAFLSHEHYRLQLNSRCKRSRDCTCRALGVCLQGKSEGLGSLECEGGHASPHDWQVATPCNVVHADLAGATSSLHRLLRRSCACMWEDLVSPQAVQVWDPARSSLLAPLSDSTPGVRERK